MSTIELNLRMNRIYFIWNIAADTYAFMNNKGVKSIEWNFSFAFDWKYNLQYRTSVREILEKKDKQREWFATNHLTKVI